MEKYLYEGHLGGLYVLDEEEDEEFLYCEECGDSDYLVAHYDDQAEPALVLDDLITRELIDMGDEYGGYDGLYVIGVLWPLDEQKQQEAKRYLGMSHRWR